MKSMHRVLMPTLLAMLSLLAATPQVRAEAKPALVVSIGSADEQDAHREMMRNMPNMVHDDPNAVTVDPGQTRELIWRFQGDQPVVFACNIPGHSEAGMVAKAMLIP